MSLNKGTLLFSQLSAAEKLQVNGTVTLNDRINFSVTGSISLAADLPTVKGKLTIEGPGADKLIINGVNQYRIFNVGANGDPTVAGLRLFQGHDDDSGGAISNSGSQAGW